MRRRELVSDKVFFILIMMLMIFSLVVLYSATFKMQEISFAADYWTKQSMWMAIGFIVMILIGNTDYRNIGHLAYFIYGLNLLLVIAVLFIGKNICGAKRWISMGGITIQPSEFMKMSLIIMLGWYLYSTKESKNWLQKMFVAGIIVFIPMIFILKEPDLGTSLVFIPIYFSMLFVAGIPVKYLFSVVFAGIACSPIAWMFLREYQKKRIYIFLNPHQDQFGSGWTIIQSKIAIGSGAFFGKGFLKGTQTQLDFLPEHHTDFIFSVIGEEFGFLGGAAIIILFFLIITRAINIAHQSYDELGKLLITGICSMIAFQVFVNIGMTFGIMPTTGIPLPLVSYGGSSMLSILIGFGIVLAVRRKW